MTRATCWFLILPYQYLLLNTHISQLSLDDRRLAASGFLLVDALVDPTGSILSGWLSSLFYHIDRHSLPTQVFLTQGLGVGIATGITYVPGLGVISHYFHRRRATAIGIATSVRCTLVKWRKHELTAIRDQHLEELFTLSC